MTKLNFIIDAQYKAGNALSKAEKGIDSLDRKAGRTSGRSGGLGKLGLLMGGGLTVAAGAAVAAVGSLATAIVSSTQKAADLESQMSGIAAVMGKTKEEVAPLKDLILQLGIDPRLKVNATEAANAIEMLGRNGLTMSQILDGAAESTVLLANATGADFGTAADIATDTMSLFNIEAKDMGRAVDGITSVVNNSKFSIDDYRLALAQGGGVAATVGMTFDDFNTTIAAISPLFASGSDAGTSLKTMLQRLIPQSNEAADKMRALGLFSGLTEKEFEKLNGKIDKQRDKIRQLDPESKNYQERLNELTVELKSMESQLVAGNNAFFDQDGNMRSMTEISDVLSQAMAGLSDEQRNSALSTIFGSDAMRAAAGVAEMGNGKFKELKQTMGNTSAEDAAKVRVDNLKGSMEILSGIVETIQLRIGEKFIPVIRRMTDAFAAFMDRHADSIVSFFDNLAVGVSNALDWIEKLAGGSERELPRMSHAANMSVDGVVAGLNRISENAPKAIDAMADMVVGMVDWIAQTGVPRLVDAIMQFPDTVRDAFSEDGPESPAGKLLNSIITALVKIQVALVEASGRIAWAIIRGFINGLVPGGEEATKAIEEWAEKMWNAFKNFLGISSPSRLFYDAGVMVMQGFTNAIGDHWNQSIARVAEFASSVINSFADRINSGSFAGSAHEALSGFVETFNGRTGEIRNHLGSLALGIADSFVHNVGGWKFSNAAHDAMQGFVNVFNSRTGETQNHLGSLAGSIADSFIHNVGGWKFSDAAHNAMQGFIDKANERSGEVRNHLSSVGNSIADAFKGPLSYDILKSRGEDIMNGLRDGVNSRIDSVRNKISDAANSIKETFDEWFDFGSPSKVTAQMGKWIMEGLASGINAEIGNVTSAIDLAMGDVVGSMGESITNNTSNQNTANNFNVNMLGGDGGQRVDETARLLNVLTQTVSVPV